MTKPLDALEVGQAAFLGCNKELALGDDSIAVKVDGSEDLLEDVLGLLSVCVGVGGMLLGGLVVHAVDGSELVMVENAVTVQVMQVEKGHCLWMDTRARCFSLRTLVDKCTPAG